MWISVWPCVWGRMDVLETMPPWMGGGEMIQDVYMAGLCIFTTCKLCNGMFNVTCCP